MTPRRTVQPVRLLVWAVVIDGMRESFHGSRENAALRAYRLSLISRDAIDVVRGTWTPDKPRTRK